MMLDYITLFFSLFALYLGAKLLTEGARHLAKVANVSDFVIGVTIVAFGTSLPELASSIFAMLSGHPGIVVGNVLGSNVANIGLALGLAGMLYPFYVSRQIIDIDIPFFLASSIATLVVFIDLQLNRIEGFFLILMYMAFLQHEISQQNESPKTVKGKIDYKQILGLCSGIVLLYLGARFLIPSLLGISMELGINESLVAFFLLAIGTSLPEIATSILAAKAGKADMAIGNALGSNAFNSLIILGSSSLIGVIPVGSSFLISTLPTMILLSILLGFMSLNNRITRLEGVFLFLIYCILVINLL
jgi:cation:H+ antiporter